MIPFNRATERFRILGIDLNNPQDSIRPGFAPILENVRSYVDGLVEPRLGLSVINTVSSTNKTPIHSIRRLNDPNSGNWIRVVGVQDTLSFMNSTSTASAFTRATYNASDVTLSGNPLSLVPFRPDQATASWLYVADSTAMRKIVGYNSQSITRGTVHQIGVAPPANPPQIELGEWWNGNFGLSFSALGTAPNDWEVDGVVFQRPANPNLIRRIPAASTTTRVVFDEGSSDWCSVVMPDAFMSTCGKGQLLYILISGPAIQPAIVADVLAGSASVSGGVQSIIYENTPTNTGVCLIYPSRPLAELTKHAVVLLNGATYSQVLDVIPGQGDRFAIRCNTGATTITAGQSLQVMPCFRTFCSLATTGTNVYEDSGGAGTAGAITIIGTGTASNKTGWLQITPATPFDMTAFTLLGTGGAFNDDDYLHVSLRVSDLSKISQGRLLFDCDTTSINISATANNGAGLIRVTTATLHELQDGDTVYINNHNASTNGTWIVDVNTNTTFDLNGSAFVANAGAVGTVQPQFKKNFYYRAFSPNDIIAATKGQDTATNNRTTVVQRRQLTEPAGWKGKYFMPDEPDPVMYPYRPGNEPVDPTDPNAPPVDRTPDSQTTTGDGQWTELIFRRKDLVPVGELAMRGKMNAINAVRLELTVIDLAEVWCDVNSITSFGGDTLDVFDLAIPYQYRYRYRAATTGARSNWSPATWSGETPQRGTVTVNVAAPSGAPEVDTIDIQRLGGALTNWYDVGSTATSSLAFTDRASDEFALGSRDVVEDNVNFQPWVVAGAPFAGTATSVSGNYIITSAALPTSMAIGTPMKVNGINCSYIRTINASTRLYEVDTALGALSNVTVEIPEPILYGQALPTLWGPFMGVFFACGDAQNPGVLYWTNSNNPDGTTERNRIEVTSPSEPLQNGCVFNGKAYVWSSERMFEIQSFGPGLFVPVDLPSGRGLFSRWGIAVGERIWYLSKDGIYQTGGGDSVSITDDTLRPLFVREGGGGTAINGFNPPDLTQTTFLRLSYYDGYLYFVYRDTAGATRCMVYTARAKEPGWWPDSYLDGQGIRYFYGEEGSGVHNLLAGSGETNARLFSVSGAADAGAAIPCRLRTQAFDAQDRRALKNFGDLIIDADSQGATINLTAYINNASTTATLSPAVASTSTAGRTQTIIDTSSGQWFEARNLALEASWSSQLSPKLYMWEPSYIVLPEDSKLRATFWDNLGLEQDKFIQGIEITTDTDNIARTVRIEYDGGTLADTLTIQHDGLQTKAYAFHPAFTAHNVRLRPTDSNQWKNFSYKWVWQPEPPLADRWESQQTSLGYDQFLHMRYAYVTLKSTQSVSFSVTRTDDSTTTTYTIPTTAGVKKKVLVPLQAPVSKGKAFIFVLTSTGAGGSFRLYKNDTTLFVKPWASGESFANRTPFGADHGNGAAPI